MYRVGFPGWKLAARVGIPLFLRLEVVRDDEASTFTATSPDLAGLVVEGSNTEELFANVFDCVDMLLEELLHRPLKHRPAAAWNGEFLSA